MKQNNTQRYIDILKHTLLFKDINVDLADKILKEFTYTTIKKGKHLEPDIGIKFLHIILDGRLKITKIDPKTGRSITLFILHTGDIHDIFTLLDGEEHIVFPIALDDISALSIPIIKAREIIKNYPEFNKNFLPYLGKMLRELEDFSESLVFDDTTTRLSKLILKHIDNTDAEKNDHYPLKLINNLSHESLAELIGSVRSVVSIQLEKLKKEEIIISKRGYLAVKNLKKLIKKCDIFEE